MESIMIRHYQRCKGFVILQCPEQLNSSLKSYIITSNIQVNQGAISFQTS